MGTSAAGKGFSFGTITTLIVQSSTVTTSRAYESSRKPIMRRVPVIPRRLRPALTAISWTSVLYNVGFVCLSFCGDGFGGEWRFRSRWFRMNCVRWLVFFWWWGCFVLVWLRCDDLIMVWNEILKSCKYFEY